MGIDNPLLSARAREAAQSMLITARYIVTPRLTLVVLNQHHMISITSHERLIVALDIATVAFRVAGSAQVFGA